MCVYMCMCVFVCVCVCFRVPPCVGADDIKVSTHKSAAIFGDERLQFRMSAPFATCLSELYLKNIKDEEYDR